MEVGDRWAVFNPFDRTQANVVMVKPKILVEADTGLVV
tara:strand:+ start:275 stop:388 length:114 start_codon:yes stop_codon:yes gene_type:complete